MYDKIQPLLIKTWQTFRSRLSRKISYLPTRNLPEKSQDFTSDPVAAYAQISNEWKPYLMKGSASNLQTHSVSTDENGARVTYFQGVPTSYSAYRTSAGNYSVLLGNSVAYGVGATNDCASLASQLAQLTGHPWYNLAGRAYNQTQEILSLLLLGADIHRHIVVFSGINNLIFTLAFDQFNQAMMPFWGQDKLDELNQNTRSLGHRMNREQSRLDLDLKYTSMMSYLDRDLRILSGYPQSLSEDNFSKTKIIYVFQPILAWLDKQLHPNEQAAVAKWDQETKSIFKVAHQPAQICPWQTRYLGDLERVCHKYQIRFFDMNSSPVFQKPEHLFLDRIHLTDLGQLRAAECIKAFLDS